MRGTNVKKKIFLSVIRLPKKNHNKIPLVCCMSRCFQVTTYSPVSFACQRSPERISCPSHRSSIRCIHPSGRIGSGSHCRNHAVLFYSVGAKGSSHAPGKSWANFFFSEAQGRWKNRQPTISGSKCVATFQ